MGLKMTLNGKVLRVSTISDIHLGHKRNTSEFIIANLDKYFSNEEHLSIVDLVVIVGDFFDDLLSLASEDVGIIDSWIARFLRLCYKFNVVVRVLEGTPSHDRGQSERFVIINEIQYLSGGRHLDLKYIKTLSIEHIEKFDINVLYVPDEWSHTTDETLVEVKELLLSKSIEQVDFAFMHGAFEYQLPAVVKDTIKHSSKEYLQIVKYLIFIGHVHQHSSYEKIHSQGSFDRLAQGENEAKGFLSAIVNPDTSYEMKFIENVTARKFITVVCKQDDTETNLRKIDKAVKKLPNGSFVRVEAEYTNSILTSLDLIKRRWPLLVWSSLAKKDTSEKEMSVFTQEDTYIPVKIDKDTLLPLVLARLLKLNINPAILDKCKMHLKESIET
jgi:predicted MPP superfamily phosphohydrolase